MPRIHVCPLRSVADTVATSSAGHLVTLLSPSTPAPPTPSGIDAASHLQLFFNDITAPMAGHLHPTVVHVGDILDFARRWPREAPVVVHCFAGISRSTAAAFMIACALEPDADERRVAAALRQASPTATPNSLMIALADEALRRSGRMIRAIEAIGRGADAFEGAPFVLELPTRRQAVARPT